MVRGSSHHHSKHYERSAYLAETLLVNNQARWSIYSIERISIKIRTKERPEAILPVYSKPGETTRIFICFSDWEMITHEPSHYSNYDGQYAMWVVFVIPTVLIALDFEKVSLGHRKTFIEHAHYFAVFLATSLGLMVKSSPPRYLDQPVNLALDGYHILVIHEKAGVTTLDFISRTGIEVPY